MHAKKGAFSPKYGFKNTFYAKYDFTHILQFFFGYACQFNDKNFYNNNAFKEPLSSKLLNFG